METNAIHLPFLQSLYYPSISLFTGSKAPFLVLGVLLFLEEIQKYIHQLLLTLLYWEFSIYVHAEFARTIVTVSELFQSDLQLQTVPGVLVELK